MSTQPKYLKPLNIKTEKVEMTHGAGGLATAQLIEEVLRNTSPMIGSMKGMTAQRSPLCSPPLSSLVMLTWSLPSFSQEATLEN